MYYNTDSYSGEDFIIKHYIISLLVASAIFIWTAIPIVQEAYKLIYIYTNYNETSGDITKEEYGRLTTCYYKYTVKDIIYEGKYTVGGSCPHSFEETVVSYNNQNPKISILKGEMLVHIYLVGLVINISMLFLILNIISYRIKYY